MLWPNLHQEKSAKNDSSVEALLLADQKGLDVFVHIDLAKNDVDIGIGIDVDVDVDVDIVNTANTNTAAVTSPHRNRQNSIAISEFDTPIRRNGLNRNNTNRPPTTTRVINHHHHRHRQGLNPNSINACLSISSHHSTASNYSFLSKANGISSNKSTYSSENSTTTHDNIEFIDSVEHEELELEHEEVEQPYYHNNNHDDYDTTKDSNSVQSLDTACSDVVRGVTMIIPKNGGGHVTFESRNECHEEEDHQQVEVKGVDDDDNHDNDDNSFDSITELQLQIPDLEHRERITTSTTTTPTNFELSSTGFQKDREKKEKQFHADQLESLEKNAEEYKTNGAEVPDIIVAQINYHRNELQNPDKTRIVEETKDDNGNNDKQSDEYSINKKKKKLMRNINTTSSNNTKNKSNNNNNENNNNYSSRKSKPKRQRIRLGILDEIHVSPCQCALSLVGMKGKVFQDFGESLFGNLIGLDNPKKSIENVGGVRNSSSMVRTESANARVDKGKSSKTHENKSKLNRHNRVESVTFDAIGYHEITLIRNRIDPKNSLFHNQHNGNNSNGGITEQDSALLDWDAITIRCSNHDELDILVKALKDTSHAKVVPFSSNPKEKLKLRKERKKKSIYERGGSRTRLYSDPSATVFGNRSHERLDRLQGKGESNKKTALRGAISEDRPLFINIVDDQEKTQDDVSSIQGGNKNMASNEIVRKDEKDTVKKKERRFDFHFNKKEYCELCDLVFTLLTRRHHCRQCQRSICSNCSSLLLIKGGDEKRFCNRCSAEILRKQSEALRGKFHKKHLQSDKLPGKVHPACHILGVGVMGKLPRWNTFLTRNVDERPAVGRVTIEVIEAIALPCANMVNGKADPFVQATVTGYDRDMLWLLREWMPHKRYSIHGGYVSSTLSPQWRGPGKKGGELLTLPVISTAGAILRLEVMDFNEMQKHPLLGIVEIPLSDLPNANLRNPGGINIDSNGRNKGIIYDGYCDRWYRLLSSDQVAGNSILLSKPIPPPHAKKSGQSQKKAKIVQKSLEEIGKKIQGLWIQPIEWVASAIKLDLPARRPEVICEEHRARSMIHVRIKLNASVQGDVLSHAWFPPVRPRPSIPAFDPQILFGRFVVIGKQLEPFKKVQEYIEKCIKWEHTPKVCIRAYFVFAFHLVYFPYLIKIFHVYLFIFLGIRLRLREMELQFLGDDNAMIEGIPHVDSMSSVDMALELNGKEQNFQNSPSLAELNKKYAKGEVQSNSINIESSSDNRIHNHNSDDEDETARLNGAVHWIAKKVLDNKGLETMQFKLGNLGRDLKRLNAVWNGTNPLLTRAAMVYLVISFILHFLMSQRLLWLMGTFTWYFMQSPFFVQCIRMFFGFWRGVAKGLRRQHLLDAEVLDAL